MPLAFFSSLICRKLTTSSPSGMTAFSAWTAREEGTGSLSSMSMYSPSLVRPMPRGWAKDMIMWGLYPPVKAMGMSALLIAF